MKDGLLALADRYFEEMRAVRRCIHRHPELSYAEYDTTKRIRETLEKYGIAIENIPSATGVSALIAGKDQTKTVVLREDIDALPITEETGLPFSSETPGVMHACGHDMHTAALLLAGVMISKMPEQPPCNVRLLFQYGEEVFGAKKMIAESFETLEPKGSVIVGLHCDPRYPVGKAAMTRGPAEASSDKLRLTVEGKGGHGAYPHKVVDPVVCAAYLIAELQTLVSRETTPFEPVVLTFGSIHGGTAANIVPDAVVIEGTLRTLNDEVRAQLWEAIRRVCAHGGEALRCGVEVEIEEGVPVVYNDERVVDVLEKTMDAVIGGDNLVWREPSPGSDDFSCFLKDMPGAQFFLGTANENPQSLLGLHTSKIVFDEEAIRIGALLLSQFVYDWADARKG